MNKKVISFSVYINLGELQNCPAFLMHKQALEKRWHLGGMGAKLPIAPYVTTTFFTQRERACVAL